MFTVSSAVHRVPIALPPCPLLLEPMVFATLDNVVLMCLFLVADKVKNFVYLLPIQFPFFCELSAGAFCSIFFCVVILFVLSKFFTLHNETFLVIRMAQSFFQSLAFLFTFLIVIFDE